MLSATFGRLVVSLCLSSPFAKWREHAAFPALSWENIQYTWTIRNCVTIYLNILIYICVSLHMQYVYRIWRDIHLPMGSLSFFRREIRRERERERLSVVVPEWAVVHSDVSCSDWLLVSLAALCDLNIFRQKSLRPRTAPWICSSLEEKGCRTWAELQWSLDAQGNEVSFPQPPPDLSILWGCYILNSKHTLLSET